jgi:exocyst complex component 5
MQLGDRNSSLAYLRLLQSSRGTLATLVDDLKGINYKGVQGVETVGSISATLDQSLEDLFVPYLENGRYIEREVKSLHELYGSFLYKFNGFHVRTSLFLSLKKSQRKSTRNKMLDRIANQIQSSANPSLDSLKKLAGLERKKGDGKATDFEFTEMDGTLQTQAAKRMLRWHAEAVSRVIELTPHSDLYDRPMSLINLG